MAVIPRYVTVPPILNRLREDTREAHERLEARLDLLAVLRRPEARADVVARFLAHHRAEEADLAPWLEPVEGLVFDQRRRSTLIARDLEQLGGVVAPSPSPEPATNLEEALGRFYVLEGSTLGGRVIAKALQSNGEDLRGLSFFDPYGRLVGDRWQGLVALLSSYSSGDDAAGDRMTLGALKGFSLAEARLVPTRVAGEARA